VGRSAGPAGPAPVPRPRPAPLPLPVPPRAGGSSQPRACGSGDPSRGQARARAALLSPLGWPLLCHGCALRAADVFCLGLSHLVAMRSQIGLIESWNCMIVCNSVWLLIAVRCRIHLRKQEIKAKICEQKSAISSSYVGCSSDIPSMRLFSALGPFPSRREAGGSPLPQSCNAQCSF